MEENNIETLQTSCKGARIKLQEELLYGKRLLIESIIDTIMLLGSVVVSPQYTIVHGNI